MILESLRLKGFTGILKGLGLEEISIDFTGIEGLTALDGMNGSGKTTVIENAHMFNCLASRDGALYQHCYLRNSEKEFTCFHGGDHYRTLLKIDAQSGKSEGYLWKNGEPQVNGKISAYAAYVRDLLGSPSLFFASVFCAQGSKKINEMTTGKLKELFAEFLRLHRYQEWEQTAKQAGNLLADRAEQLETRIVGLRERLKGLDGITEAIDREQKKVDASSERLDSERRVLIMAQGEAENTRQRIARQAAVIERRDDVKAAIARQEEHIRTEGEAVETELSGLRTKYEDLARQIKALDAILADREYVLGAADQEKELTARIETLADEVETLQAAVMTRQEALQAAEEEIRGLEKRDDELLHDPELSALSQEINNVLTPQIEDRNRKIRALNDDLELDRLSRRVVELEGKTVDLDRKDPACQSTTCSFIVGALKAQEELPAAREAMKERAGSVSKQISGLIDEKAVLEVGRETKQKALQDRADFIREERERVAQEKAGKCEAKNAARLALTETTDTLSRFRKALATARFDVGKVRDLSARAPEIQVAEARRKDLAEQLQDVTDKGAAAKSAWETRKAGLEEAVETDRVKLAGIVSEIVPDLDAMLVEQNAVIARITDNISEAEREISAAREQVTGLQNDLKRMEEAGREAEELEKRKAGLLNESAEWRYLQDRCGKNGLQALEIDGAAPLISSYANDLLARAFGPLYSVRFRTQDDEGRECLDIMTIGEDGGEVLLDNLSGGQKVWILMALRLAMTLLSKEKGGRQFETAFFDEMDGALDPENAVSFISMYRAFAEIGDFRSVLFISHKPECRGMADNILKFESGKAPAWD
jgi:DNA repair exonuclease SbcCD ATPase subunit